jgi:hypothetical protein
MPEPPKQRKPLNEGTKGPVKPESVLYRILQRIAREIARSLTESRGTQHGPRDPSQSR